MWMCLQTHLPGYVSDFDKLSQAGAQIIACVSVNDPFVMAEWGKVNKADGKVSMSCRTSGMPGATLMLKYLSGRVKPMHLV